MERWVKAGVINNRFEGDRIRHSLGEAGIPFFVKSFLDTAYDGLFLPQKGWGVIMVPETSLEEAERIVVEVKTGFEREDQDDIE